MPQLIPSGTEIIPCSTETGAIGVSRLTSIDITLENDSPYETIGIQTEPQSKPVQFVRIPLPPNESKFDAYLVRVDACQNQDE